MAAFDSNCRIRLTTIAASSVFGTWGEYSKLYLLTLLRRLLLCRCSILSPGDLGKGMGSYHSLIPFIVDSYCLCRCFSLPMGPLCKRNWKPTKRSLWMVNRTLPQSLSIHCTSFRCMFLGWLPAACQSQSTPRNLEAAVPCFVVGKGTSYASVLSVEAYAELYRLFNTALRGPGLVILCSLPLNKLRRLFPQQQEKKNPKNKPKDASKGNA